MGYFGYNTLEQNIFEDVLSWQESFKASDAYVVYSLAKIIQYFVNKDCDEVMKKEKE